MKLPFFFYVIIFWLVGIVVNLLFKSIFGFINFNESYGFLMLLIYSLDYTIVFLLRKKFSFSLLTSIILFLSVISVFIFMTFIWNHTGRESVLGQFVFLFLNLILFLLYIDKLWGKFKFDYLNHLIIVVLYAISSSVIYLGLFKLISAKNSTMPSLIDTFLKQTAFIVPYPFIFKISEAVMIFLEKNFTTPTERIIIEDKPKDKNNTSE